MSSLVSVIVPIYKVESYLPRCVESIIRQSYKNLEIILVDDGSPDRCPEICDAYAHKDSRIIVVHKKNGGLSDARNVGMRIASGDIISFVDSDDWIEETMVEDTVRTMEDTRTDIVLFGAYVTDGKNTSTAFTSGKCTVMDSGSAIELAVNNSKISSHAWDKLYRRKVWDNLEFPVGKLYEDVFVMHNVFKKADSIAFLDRPYYYYYQRPGSIISNRTLQSYRDLIEGTLKRLDDLSDYPDTITDWVRYGIIRENVDLFRILATLNCKDQELIEEYRALFEKYDPNGTLRKRLPGNMQLDCKLIEKSPDLYMKVRRNLNKMKVAKIRPVLGRGKRAVMRTANQTVHTLKPLRFDETAETDEARIILMGGPEYNNLGDHAIAYATQKFFEKHFPDYQYIEVTEEEVRWHLGQLKKKISAKDVLLLQGGGNLGNIYPDQQRIRSRIITAFPDNTIIMMPQTIHFTDDKEGRKELGKTIRLYSHYGNVILGARESISDKRIRKVFKSNVSYLTPDIVLSLDETRESERTGIALCLRDDAEGVMELAEKNYIQKCCSHYTDEISAIDTCVDKEYDKEQREELLKDFFVEVSKRKLVITDRLHGMIFCAITNTPCIALANNNHKVYGVYKWLKAVPWIQFCENVYDIDSYISDLLAIDVTESINLDKEFLPLVEVVKNALR